MRQIEIEIDKWIKRERERERERHIICFLENNTTIEYNFEKKCFAAASKLQCCVKDVQNFFIYIVTNIRDFYLLNV